MSDSEPGAMRAFTGGEFLAILSALRDASHSFGRAYSYGDCLNWLQRELAQLEEELTRKPDDSLVIGGIMLASRFIDAFEGAPPHFEERGREHAREFVEVMSSNTTLEEHSRELLRKLAAHINSGIGRAC